LRGWPDRAPGSGNVGRRIAASVYCGPVYTVIISLLIGSAAGAALGYWTTWAFGAIVGLVIAVAAFAITSRILAKRVEPHFLQAQKQIQAGAVKGALKSLEDLLPMARWQVLLKGQIYAQMGSLAYSQGDMDAAFEYLQKSSKRVADAQIFLAALHYRRKDYAGAKSVMESAIQYNKKQVMPYNVLAWMQLKEGESAQAVETLLRCEKVDKSSEATKDNLNRVQNGKKMNMKRFGMTWYALQLEKPPASMRQAPPGSPRAGFRQKKRGGKR
jgi:tetratricopeptide (TPR) repeat protein